MSLRSLAERLAMLLPLALFAVPAHARDFTDSAARRVVLPAQIGRIMAAGPGAAVLAYVLAPDKLAGWPTPLPYGAAGYLPPRYARLPVIGRLTGAYPTATAATVQWVHPDLIIDTGSVSPQRIAFADYIERTTRVPYIIVDSSIQRMPDVLRTLGAVLGVQKRGEELGAYAQRAISAVRGTLLISSPTSRARLYYARGWNGLATVLPETRAGEEIDESGAINVAAPLGLDGRMIVTRQQLLAWNPDTVIAENRRVYDELQQDPYWSGLAAVQKKRVYLAPLLPFGWVGDPASVNRLLGLSWLTALLYPDSSQEDLSTLITQFYQQFYGVKLSDRQLAELVRHAEAHPGQLSRSAEVPLLGLGAALPVPMPSMPGSPSEPSVPGARGRPMPRAPRSPGAGNPATPGLGLPPLNLQ